MNEMNTDTLIIERLARVEEKLDNFLIRVMDQHDKLDDHEVRIRSLESHRAWLIGVGAVAAAGIGVFGDRIMGLLI